MDARANSGMAGQIGNCCLVASIAEKEKGIGLHSSGLGSLCLLAVVAFDISPFFISAVICHCPRKSDALPITIHAFFQEMRLYQNKQFIEFCLFDGR